MKCAKCGTHGEGKFCGECGNSLGEIERPSFCNHCGTAVAGEERFCTECGTSLDPASQVARVGPTPRAANAAPAADSTQKAPRQPLYKDSSFLMVAAASALALGAGIVVGKLGSGGEEITPVSGVAPAGNPAAIDLSSMTPEEAAERLYVRVVSSAENGDTASAQQFLPMAIAAHDRAEPLTDDGVFHRAILERLAGETAASIASAERILTNRPTHLLALASAAEAATDGSDIATARTYYQRFLDAYDAELGVSLPEYDAHSQMFPGMRAAALLATAGS